MQDLVVRGCHPLPEALDELVRRAKLGEISAEDVLRVGGCWH